MQWLNKIVDEVISRNPSGEIIISSGASPSGTYHIGHVREIIISDAVLRELKKRGREVRHIHFVDDLDGLRKVPVNVSADFEQYLGQPLCDIPSPDGVAKSYGEFFVKDFLNTAEKLGIDMEVVYSHQKYRSGFFVRAIEQTLSNLAEAKRILEEVSGRSLGEEWFPIQVNEGGYLKKRPFVSIDTESKTLIYLDKDGNKQEISYERGDVKLDWRLDWPARWALVGVKVEGFGRDHASSGGSFDTGKVLVKAIFGAEAPVPVPYDFVNRAGDTKKMSASKGTGVSAAEVVEVLPPEIVRYFMLRFAPDKRLYFDTGIGAMQLFDEFAKELIADGSKDFIEICLVPGKPQTISNVPFSHLVASYQAALKDKQKTIEIISRTEHADVAHAQSEVIERELGFIDRWLEKWAPEDIKFELKSSVEPSDFNDHQKQFLNHLASTIENAPAEADGEWFHKAIYELKDQIAMQPKEMFQTLYQALIGKNAGPRAGWFLSILPRDWLIARLKLEK